MSYFLKAGIVMEICGFPFHFHLMLLLCFFPFYSDKID